MENKINVKYDGELDIAIGRSRKEVNWKNKTVTWSAFLNRIKETHRTHETFSQYMGMNKTMQSDIKDIGGFVGGFIAGGRRKIENVSHRQLVTLDIDFGTMDIWSDFKLMGYAGAMYSTHKHSSDKPRLRLIVPLDREVSREEYEPIARHIANEYDINTFDDTTFDVCRLMYWPSSPKDGDYIFEYSDGEWMSADDILKSYYDWRDASSWPISERVDKAVHSEIKKQEVPTEKKGIVGAFCRTYSISEAISKFLAEEYEACDIENRFTYKHGSTAAGLVVYDDLFAFSHHGTDPASGKLCNAFDLVRIHKFGIKDDGVHGKTNISKYPSFIAMEELATQDNDVKMTIAREKSEEASRDFADIEIDEEYSDEWMADLEVDRKRNYIATYKNVRLILDNDPYIRNRFANDIFSKRIAVLKDLPWRKIKGDYDYLTDADEAELRIYLSSEPWGVKGKDLIHDVLVANTSRDGFHPVCDYLNPLVWDRIPRIDTLFIEALGVDDTAYSRACSRKMLIAAIERVFDPGSYMDYTMAFIGEEGVGKSKFLGRLARNKKWHVDSFSVDGKEAYENIRGKWLVEIAELTAVKNSDPNKVKNFLSKTVDFYRASYDRYPQDWPRQCVFFGSGNDEHFLKGIGGDRRFWPVKVDKDKITKRWDKFTDYELDQVWAEAKHFYTKGEKPYLPPELEKVAKQMQKGYTEVDSWEDQIDDFLNKLLPEDWESKDEDCLYDFTNGSECTAVRNNVTTLEIWKLCFSGHKAIDYLSQSRIVKIMNRKEDWEYSRFRRNGKQFRGWVRVTP